MSEQPQPAPARAAIAGRVTAVVVNHNAGSALIDCVRSLREEGLGEVVVVDNASSDGSLELLAASDAAVRIVPTGRNLGYGRAANIGAKRSTGELVLVCNPDLVVRPGAIADLVSVLDAQAGVGIIGPKILDAAGGRYPSARAFPNLVDAAGHAILGMFHPDNAFSRRYRRDDHSPEEAGTVDWLSGAFLLVRRVAFESLGGFDEGYFMYVEDLDLCWRLGRAGWGAWYEPSAVVVHSQGLSASRHPVRMLVAHHRSTWRFARRSMQGPSRALLPVVGAGLAARLAVALGRELAAKRGSTPGAPD